MNISVDLRGSINKKFKTLKGKKVEINDISNDIRPSYHDNPKDLKRIDLSELKTNSLFKSTFVFLINQIKKSSYLKGFILREPKVSLFYRRDWKDSFDLVIDFFCRIGETTQFLFFEADLNTNGKVLSNGLIPRLYSLQCYKIVDEYPSPENLISVANNVLNTSNIKSFSVVNVILANNLYVIDLLNPESFTLVVIVQDEFKNQNKAIIAYTIEEETHHIQLATFEIVGLMQENIYKPLEESRKNDEVEKLTEKNAIKKEDLDFFVVAGECSYEILVPSLLVCSNHLKQTIDFIRKEKIIDEMKYGKKLDTLLAGVSMKNDLGLITLICDFAYVENENTYLINQVSLLVKKKSNNNNELEFTLKKVETNFMQEMDIKQKNAPNHFDIMKAIDSLVNEKNQYKYIRDIEVYDLTKIYYVNNDNLVFPEHFAVNFTYMTNKKKLKKGCIFYTLHDFDRSFIPISFYEIEDNGHILKHDYSKHMSKDSDLILDLNLIIEEKHNESYNIVQIPSNLNYQINEYINPFIPLIKSNIATKNNDIIFKSDFAPIIAYSQLRQFNDCSHDLVSYVQMMINDQIILISEVAVKIRELYSTKKDNCELKSIKSLILIDLDHSEYPDYGLILSLLWANSINNLSSGMEILCIKRSNCHDLTLYFSEIYYIEFQIFLNYSNYSFIYGVTKGGEITIIKPISILPKNLTLYSKKSK